MSISDGSSSSIDDMHAGEGLGEVRANFEEESRTNEPSHNDDSISNDDHGTTTRIENQSNESTIQQNVSLAHHHKSLENDSCVLFSLDLETGGPKCGIIQLSVVAFLKSGKILGEFDKFITPPLEAIWSEQAMQVHNLRPSLDCIKNADKIERVWPDFVVFVERFLDGGQKKGIIIAWSGKSCNAEWLFQVTEGSIWKANSLPHAEFQRIDAPNSVPIDELLPL
jgi:hypothetical protein